MKWYSFLVILAVGAVIALGGVWLWKRKKATDAKVNGGVALPDPAHDPAVGSILERARKRLHDLFDKYRTS